MLVNMLECGDVVPGAYDNYPNPSEGKTIEASVSRICRLNGVQVPGETMEDILNRLYIDTELCGDILTCEVPAFRQDMDREADIAEEVLRMYGYDHIPSTLMNGVTMAGRRSETMAFNDRVKRALVGMGLYEILNYSFISPKWIENLGIAEDDPRRSAVVLRNPLGEDTSVMRTSMVPAMLNTIANNLNRGNAAGRLFELSKTFQPAAAGELPAEKHVLVLGMFGADVDFYSVKNACMWLMQTFGVTPAIAAGGDSYYHPGRKAVLTVGETQLAQLGEIHPDVAERFGIEARAYIAEIDLDALRPLEAPLYGVKPLPKYPAVTRDIALVVDEKVGVGTMLETIKKSGGKTLESATLFDIYRGEKLGADKKSVAYALSFRASDRTLIDEEIAGSMAKILKTVEAEYGAELR